MQLHIPFVLASASPRRRRLLEQLGLAFDVVVSGVSEVVAADVAPDEMVEVLAQRKAEAVGRDRPEALVLGADTIVVLDGDVLEKPGDECEARLMLRRLSGRTHTVYSGIALVHPTTDRAVCRHVATHVTFGDLSDDEIDDYVASGSPMDKAGSYGIQDDRGALFVERVDGDYYNVVGLPLHTLYRTLQAHFGDVFTVRTSS